MLLLLLSVVILAIAVLLFDVRGETYVDIRHTSRGVVVDIDAHEKGGFRVYWHNADDYAIYRTSEAWSSPNLTQLKLSSTTGIALRAARGTYGKSFVDYQIRIITTNRACIISPATESCDHHKLRGCP